MYQKFIDQNPILNRYNDYRSQNPDATIPFQNNRLIHENFHVANSLNMLVNNHRTATGNFTMPTTTAASHNIPIQTAIKNGNIIENLLRPTLVVRDNADVKSRYEKRYQEQEAAREGKQNIRMTNTPYKNIITDERHSMAHKKVENFTLDDLLVHKTDKRFDADLEKFQQEFQEIDDKRAQENKQLEIDFHIDNYSTHKEKFEYSEAIVRNMACNQPGFDKNKEESIKFFKKLQKKAEKDKKLVDELLMSFDDSIVGKNELPCQKTSGSKPKKAKQKSSSKNISNL